MTNPVCLQLKLILERAFSNSNENKGIHYFQFPRTRKNSLLGRACHSILEKQRPLSSLGAKKAILCKNEMPLLEKGAGQAFWRI